MGTVRQLVLATAAAAGVLLAAPPAAAHDLRLKVDTTQDPVVVTAWFTDDDPADKATVTVTNEAGEVAASGVTDERGVFTFPRPTAAGTYTVTAESIGHREAVSFPVAAGAGGEFTGWRMNRWLGLGIGVALLLGGSALWWWARKRS